MAESDGVMSLWERDGVLQAHPRIRSINGGGIYLNQVKGALVSCLQCPTGLCDCDLDLAYDVSFYLVNMTDENGDYVWDKETFFEANYTPGVFAPEFYWNNLGVEGGETQTPPVGQWEALEDFPQQEASGSLVPAFPSMDALLAQVGDSLAAFELNPRPMVAGWVFRRRKPLEGGPNTVVVGCQCNYEKRPWKYNGDPSKNLDGKTHMVTTFAPRTVFLWGYDVLDEVPVIREPNSARYFCLMDTCPTLNGIMDAIAELSTGRDEGGEGFLFREKENPGYDEFPWSILSLGLRCASFDRADGSRMFAVLNCQCTSITFHPYADAIWEAQRGICDDPCAYDFIELLLPAKYGGIPYWTNGVFLASKTGWTYGYGSDDKECCEFFSASTSSRKFFRIAVDMGDSWIYLPCGEDCKTQWLQKGSCTPPAWQPFSYPEVCPTCIDERLFVMRFMQQLGVIDVSFGSNTTYRATFVSTGETLHTVYRGPDYQGHQGYIDYGCIVFAYRDCSGYIYLKHRSQNPQDSSSLYGKYMYNYPTFDNNGNAGPFTEVEFTGHWEPFTRAPEGLSTIRGDESPWIGEILCWYYSYSMPSTGLFATEAEAAAFASTPADEAGQPSICQERDYFQEQQGEPLLTPTFSPVLMGGTYSKTDNGYWEAIAPYYGPDNNGIAYCLNFVETSRGFLVNGKNGYFKTLTLRSVFTYAEQNGLDSERVGNCYGHSHGPDQDEILEWSPREICRDTSGNDLVSDEFSQRWKELNGIYDDDDPDSRYYNDLYSPGYKYDLKDRPEEDET
ncbi:MAG: hypothetical protein ACI4WT_10690 [Oligosphaeraceae bacterium]